MKQPLMLTLNRIPPAQAEAMYDASLTDSVRPSPPDGATWPGEDWEDDLVSPARAMPVPETRPARTIRR